MPLGENFDNLWTLPDGSVVANVWGEQYAVREVDINSKTLGEEIPIPSDAWNIFPAKVGGGAACDFYYNTNTELHGYDLKTQSDSVILNWIDCDVNSDSISGIYVFSGDKLFCLSNG